MFGYDRAAIEIFGLADPPDGMGRDLRDAAVRHLPRSAADDRFVRVHRSFIVQPSKIRSIERNRIVFGKEYIPVSENYRQAFFDFLAEHSLLF